MIFPSLFCYTTIEFDFTQIRITHIDLRILISAYNWVEPSVVSAGSLSIAFLA